MFFLFLFLNFVVHLCNESEYRIKRRVSQYYKNILAYSKKYSEKHEKEKKIYGNIERNVEKS